MYIKVLVCFMFCLLISNDLTAKSYTWKTEKKKIITFANGKQFQVDMMSKTIKDIEERKLFKLKVKALKNGKEERVIWESNTEEGWVYEGLYIISGDHSAAVSGVFNLGGAHGLNNYFVLMLSSDGNIYETKNLNQYGFVEKKANELIINDLFQKIVFSKSGNDIVKKLYTRDQMGPSNAIPIYFSLSGENIIVKNPKMQCRVGQSIAFIPSNENSKKRFNSGEINITTDAKYDEQWDFENSDWSDYSPSPYDSIESGNSYTFKKAGTFHFLLCGDCSNINHPSLTIQVK